MVSLPDRLAPALGQRRSLEVGELDAVELVERERLARARQVARGEGDPEVAGGAAREVGQERGAALAGVGICDVGVADRCGGEGLIGGG